MSPEEYDTIGLADEADSDLRLDLDKNVSGISPEALVFVVGQEYIQTIVPNNAEILIGRQHPTNKYQPDLDLTAYGAAEAGTSRLHVALRHDDNGWMLIDMNSSNGTWVNGQRLAPFVPFPLSKTNHVFLSNFEIAILLPVKCNSRLVA